jgi:hypothetical protein
VPLAVVTFALWTCVANTDQYDANTTKVFQRVSQLRTFSLRCREPSGRATSADPHNYGAQELLTKILRFPKRNHDSYIPKFF